MPPVSPENDSRGAPTESYVGRERDADDNLSVNALSTVDYFTGAKLRHAYRAAHELQWTRPFGDPPARRPPARRA